MVTDAHNAKKQQRRHRISVQVDGRMAGATGGDVRSGSRAAACGESRQVEACT